MGALLQKLHKSLAQSVALSEWGGQSWGLKGSCIVRLWTFIRDRAQAETHRVPPHLNAQPSGPSVRCPSPLRVQQAPCPSRSSSSQSNDPQLCGFPPRFPRTPAVINCDQLRLQVGQLPAPINTQSLCSAVTHNYQPPPKKRANKQIFFLLAPVPIP